MINPEQFVGTVIDGRYRLTRYIARGSFGLVFEASHETLGQHIARVAVKIIVPQDDQHQEKVIQEIRGLAQLRHENILAYLNSGPIGDRILLGSIFLVTELAQRSLENVIQQPTRFSEEDLLAMGQGIASALAHIHRNGAVHRDVKPASIFWAEGKWKLGDFGLVQPVSETLSPGRSFEGSLGYMPPEAMNNQFGPATDVYGFGVTLLECLTGHLAHEGGNNIEQFKANLMTKPANIPDDLKEPWGTIIRGCLERDPHQRWSADQISQQFISTFSKGTKVTQNPFKFSKEEAFSVVDLIGLCDKYWDEAEDHLFNGYFEPWLVRCLGEAALAQQARFIAKGYSGEQRKGLELFVREACKSVGLDPYPDLVAQPTIINLGKISAGRQTTARLQLNNKKRGYAWGGVSIAGLAPGISVPSSFEGSNVSIDIRLDTTSVVPGNYEGNVVVRVEGISKVCTVPLRYEVVSIALPVQQKAPDRATVSSPDVKKVSRKHHTKFYTILGLVFITILVIGLLVQREDPVTHVNIGNALNTKGDWDGAINEYRRAIGLKPDFAVAYRNIGYALRSKGDLDGAIVAYRQAIKIDADDPITHANLGEALRAKGNWDGAIDEGRQAIKLKPDFATAHNNLGYALYSKGDMDGAIAAYRQAIKLEPDAPFIHANLGDALRAKGNWDGAIKEYRQAIQLKPEYAVAYGNLGNALRSKGDLDGAIVAYRQAIKIRPDLVVAKTALEDLLARKAEHPTPIVSPTPDLGYTSHFDRGNALVDEEDWDGAVNEFRKEIKIRPDFASAHKALGIALCSQEDWNGAINALRQAIKLEPGDPVAHTYLGGALYSKGDSIGAISELRQAIGLKPDYALAHSGLAQALHDKGDWDGAINEYRRAIELNPKESFYHRDLGNALKAKGDIDGASSEYRLEKALMRMPTRRTFNSGYDHYIRGHLRAAEKDWDGAISEYLQAIILSPGDPVTHYNLGIALKAKGDLDGAIRAYRQAIEIMPGYVDAQNALEDILKLRKQ